MNGAFLPHSYWINYVVYPNHREAFMKFLSKIAAVAAFAGLAFAFGSSSASAESYRPCGPGLRHCGPFIGHNPGPFPGHYRNYRRSGVGIEFRFGNAPYYDPYYHPRRIYRPVPVIRPVRFCSNDAAIYKARSLGVRNIRAISYRNHVVIKGRQNGHRVQLAFARARGCPIIRY
jgi:hypothetical protein